MVFHKVCYIKLCYWVKAQNAKREWRTYLDNSQSHSWRTIIYWPYITQNNFVHVKKYFHAKLNYSWKEPSTSYMNKPFFSQHSILTLCLYVSIIPFLCRGCTCLVEFMYSFTCVDCIIYRIHLFMYYKRVISWNHLWSIYYMNIIYYILYIYNYINWLFRNRCAPGIFVIWSV